MKFTVGQAASLQLTADLQAGSLLYGYENTSRRLNCGGTFNSLTERRSIRQRSRL
jgi:hypothetical protein